MKQKIRYFVFTILLAMVPIVHCSSVEPNPTLALRFLQAKKDYEKALQAQKRIQELVAEGHVFIGREVQATDEFQRQFNNYLDSFQGVVGIAAELYGTFLEIKHTTKLVNQISSILSEAPTNAIAMMLRPNTNRGLPEIIIQTSLLAAQDLYKACLSKQKMTEQQRQKILYDARIKIRKVNENLVKLVIALKYTSFEDIWHSIRMRAKYMDRERKQTIIERCYDNWKYNIR